MSVICPSCHQLLEAAAPQPLRGAPPGYAACPACGEPLRWLPPAAPAEEATTLLVPGWLVVGDSHAPPQRRPLRVGDNTVGRRTAHSEVEVAIDTADTTMSRRHCIVTVAPDHTRGCYTFQVHSSKATNQVFVGERTLQNQLGEQDIVYVRDGEHLLLGETRVTLEVNTEATFKPTPRNRPEDTVVRPPTGSRRAARSK